MSSEYNIVGASVREIYCDIFKGAVGAYWGCCRGCGAHL